MAKKQKNVVRTFGVVVRFVSRVAGKDSQQYGVQVRVTGGRWIGSAARKFGRMLRSRLLAKGAVLALAAALIGIAS
ncbi:hypothetical protein VT84_28725 [Gemmata sp. SH-PL17]|uniref:hypothetical protein n=1 Tax=Gemmata sp. SH-PL17 TaxID=1630693 RepID=UPI00078EB882|nr:hypothetical protein [Gemmata sp. SH-PL17]AMV28423.1 hypothetical protein VT84_28725 [Gemmata sp. SH-PL17]